MVLHAQLFCLSQFFLLTLINELCTPVFPSDRLPFSDVIIKMTDHLHSRTWKCFFFSINDQNSTSTGAGKMTQSDGGHCSIRKSDSKIIFLDIMAASAVS